MNGFTWCCPRCLGFLDLLARSWRCRVCRSVFRTLRGIPDLRTSEDTYLSSEADWKIASHLADEFDHVDFPGILNLYFQLCPEISQRQRESQINHILSAPGRVRCWLNAADPLQGPGLLDLGCGSGSFIAAVGKERPDIIGVDIAMRWLIVARKRLDEESLDNVPLACACADRLPMNAASVSAVIAGDVIEHVADQAAFLSETFRVLGRGGKIFIASPNRFSLAPEPHVGVWGVGYLPRRWMARYVRAASGLDFREIHTLGYAEWLTLLRKSPFRGGRVTVPPLPVSDFGHFGQIKRIAARVYNRLIRVRIGERISRWIGPLFHVVCEKPGTTVSECRPAQPLAGAPSEQQAQNHGE